MVEIKSQKELRNIGCVRTKTLLTRTSKKKAGKIGWRSGTFPQKKNLDVQANKESVHTN
jgi:hypothetical protein